MIRSFEDVLVKVHDKVDNAGDLHIEVALQQEQQMAVVWHDPLVSKRATSIVHISPVVNVCPLHEWLRKVLLALPVLIQAGRSVVVHHVPQYQLTILLVVFIFRHRRNLSTDNFINLIGGKRLRLHSEGKVSI